MIWLYGVSLLAGALAKAASCLDRIPGKRKFGFAASIGYGLLLGFLVWLSPEASTMFLAMLVGLIVASKVRGISAWVGVCSLFVSLALLGMQTVVLPLFALFTLTSFIDGLSFDFVQKQKGHDLLKKAVGTRFLLLIAAFGIGLASSNWIFFIFALSLDIGSRAFAYIQERIL